MSPQKGGRADLRARVFPGNLIGMSHASGQEWLYEEGGHLTAVGIGTEGL